MRWVSARFVWPTVAGSVVDVADDGLVELHLIADGRENWILVPRYTPLAAVRTQLYEMNNVPPDVDTYLEIGGWPIADLNKTVGEVTGLAASVGVSLRWSARGA